MEFGYLTFLIAFLIANSHAISKPEVNVSGILDIQTKQLNNPNYAQNANQSWPNKTENFSLAYTSIDASIRSGHHQLEANWFARYSQSQLYKDNLYANSWANYPTDLMSRDIFKLSKVDRGTDTLTESLFTRFAYTWKDDDIAFKVGRLWIQYGDGLVYNPINPFNIPFTFSTTQNLVQGNDGMEFQFLSETKLKLFLYLLGDKEIFNYNNTRFSRTVLIRGDYDYSEKLNVIYILGEDQRRHKYGLELKYSIASGFLLGQFVRNTRRLDMTAENSESLTQYIMAYERDLTENWAIRLEGGKNDQDQLSGEASNTKYMLPQENFIALLNDFNLSEKWQTQFNLSLDTKTSFTYIGFKLTHQIQKYLELHAFASAIINKNQDEALKTNQSAQLYIPSQVGIGLRSLF